MNASKPFSEYKGRSVLITGGLGFIGSNLAHRLVEIGDVEVLLVDALIQDQGGNHSNIESIRDRVNLRIANIGDDYAINHLVGGVDYVFNLAGNVSHLDSMIYPQQDLELNCAAQLTLLEACRNFNPHVKIIFTSTRQVYGKPIYLPLDEQHRVAPLDINGINKFAAEHYHLLYNRVYGTRVVCLRLTNTYGPRQLISHNRQGVIAWFIRQAMDGMPSGDWKADAPHVVLPDREKMKTQMEALIFHFKIVTEGFSVPAGEVYQAVESPRGEMGYYVVSDGTAKPMRVHMRSPSYVNLQALPKMCEGRLIADVVAAIGSIDIVLGEIDR